jgi:hypothetical protein
VPPGAARITAGRFPDTGDRPEAVGDRAEGRPRALRPTGKAGRVTLAGKECQGSTRSRVPYKASARAKVPYKGKSKPEPRKEANQGHAKLRAPRERANAQLKT